MQHTWQSVVEVVTSAHFIALLLLVAIVLVCLALVLWSDDPAGGLGWVDGYDDDCEGELPPARQDALAALAERDVWAPIQLPDADPTRARAARRGIAGGRREAIVRARNAEAHGARTGAFRA